MLDIHLLYMAVSALAFAGLDFTRKLLAGRVAPLALVFYMSLGAVPVVAALLAHSGSGWPTASYILPGVGAIALNLAGNLGFIHSLKLSPLSRTIPLLSLTPVFTALLAVPILGERPSGAQIGGIALVVIGAMALNSDAGVADVFSGLLRERGALLMAGVAVVWSLSGALDKRALEHAGVYFHATAVTLGVSAGALAVLGWKRRVAELRDATGEWPLLLASMAGVSIALVFQFLAFQGVFVSLVEAMKRAIGSLLALVLGRFVFGEGVHRNQMGAVAVMTAGVFLLLRGRGPW